jgi:AraC-like DNA-binding protein
MVDHRTSESSGRRVTPASTIRVSAVQGYRELVRDLGGDAVELLHTVGIDPAELDSADGRISYAAMIELLEESARVLRCPDFGLRLSGYQSIDILGPAAMIAHYSATIGASLQAISTYFFVHTSGATVQLAQPSQEQFLWTFEVVVPGMRARPQINELSMAIGQSLLEMLIGSRFRSTFVQFIHRKPDDIGPQVRRFGRNLHFSGAVNAVALPVAVLAWPVPTANPEFRRIAEDYLRPQRTGLDLAQASRVEKLTHQLLPTGHCSLKSVADILGVHPRSLERHLRKSGSSFRDIMDVTRRQLVADYLKDTDASLVQVAAMLGYRDQAAFNRAFQRWYGTSPGLWRRASHAD